MAEFNDLKVKQISDIIVLHMLGIFVLSQLSAGCYGGFIFQRKGASKLKQEQQLAVAVSHL